MFWGLFIFCGHSTREPESVVCDKDQSDLFYSVSQTQEPALDKLTREKLGRGFFKKKSEWTGKVRH